MVGHEPNKGWLVECQKCGRVCVHSAPKVRDGTAPKCLCECNYGKYNTPDWIGRRFGNLVTQRYVGKRGFECLCDCGNTVLVKGVFLTGGRQTTCGKTGCVYHDSKCVTHGMSKERIYRIWRGMKSRCYDPKSNGYPTYGARGIDICDEWREDLFAFRDWAYSHGYADDLSIDRIDNDRGYYPDNCRWATAVEQANNQHPKYTFSKKPEAFTRPCRIKWTIDGEKKSAKEWCEQYGVSMPFVMYRIKTKGMTPYEALTTPKETIGRPRK